MALPLLRWSCRRPRAGLSAYLRFNKLNEVRNQFAVKNQALSACVVSGVRHCSSDREGRRETRKVVVVGIPNPFIWIRTKFCFFLIRAYFDKDFSIEEFTEGAKQVSWGYFLCETESCRLSSVHCLQTAPDQPSASRCKMPGRLCGGETAQYSGKPGEEMWASWFPIEQH